MHQVRQHPVVGVQVRRRTQVQDAHDRYQETELDAVLDRLARHEGPVLVVPPNDPTA